MLYDYLVPPGYGDTFYQYVFEAQGAGLTDGNDYFQLGVPVIDGDFIMRYWSGLSTIAQKLQIYDWLGRRFASDYMDIGAGTNINGFGQMVVLPEVRYPVGGNIRMDLINVTQDQAYVDGGLTVLDSQLVFSGVRRRANVVSDPIPSAYKYYEKQYSIPFRLTISTARSTGGVFNPATQYQIPINDFDFELRRIEIDSADKVNNFADFKVTLYDSNWHTLSNLPVLADLLFNIPSGPVVPLGVVGSGELNFMPSPPVLYRVNSVIRFDVYSLLASRSIPQTYNLLFHGVRRIPC